MGTFKHSDFYAFFMNLNPLLQDFLLHLMVKIVLDVVFWSFYLITPTFAFLLLKLAGEKINKISLVNITSVALFLFSIVGTLPLFYFLDDYRYNTGVNDQVMVLTVLCYSCMNIIFFLFGVVFIRKALKMKPVGIRSGEIGRMTGSQVGAIILFFLLCVLVLYLYISQLNQVALFVGLRDGAKAAVVARSKMGNDFSGKYHWYSIFMHDLSSVITFTAFVVWLKNKKSITLLAFTITLLYSIFVAVMATEKGPLAWLLISLFMVYHLTYSDGFIPVDKLVPFGCFVVGLLVIFYIYFMGSNSTGSALWSVFSRAFSGSISPAYFYLEYFPVHQEYLLGKTFPNPGGLMPFQPVRYTVDVMNWRFPSLVEMGVVGSAPTVFWGESYANFGVWGIPFVAFFMGSFVAVISYFVSKIELTPLTIGFLVWLIVHVKQLSVTGFSGYLYSFSITIITFIFLTILFTKRKIKVRKAV